MPPSGKVTSRASDYRLFATLNVKLKSRFHMSFEDLKPNPKLTQQILIGTLAIEQKVLSPSLWRITQPSYALRTRKYLKVVSKVPHTDRCNQTFSPDFHACAQCFIDTWRILIYY